MARIPEALASYAAVPGQLQHASNLAGRLLDLVFPPRCAGCGRTGFGFCPPCQAQVKGIAHPYCPGCGRPLPETSSCRQCRATPPALSTLYSAGLYQEPLSRAIRQFKYAGQSHLAQALSSLLITCWSRQASSVDLVLAVPLHTSRLRQRGFNQAWLLGQAFCRTAGLPLLREGVLCRQRATPQQALLAMEDRQRNVAHAFLWQGPTLEGSRVLLVDDVVTSGSTLEACAEVLRQVGAGDVWAITVASAMTLPAHGGQHKVDIWPKTDYNVDQEQTI